MEHYTTKHHWNSTEIRLLIHIQQKGTIPWHNFSAFCSALVFRVKFFHVQLFLANWKMISCNKEILLFRNVVKALHLLNGLDWKFRWHWISSEVWNVKLVLIQNSKTDHCYHSQSRFPSGRSDSIVSQPLNVVSKQCLPQTSHQLRATRTAPGLNLNGLKT